MQLDDTKHRVYIHNLDDELSDIESDEEKLIFLPDIEKKFNTIPRHILVGEKKDTHQELVLYNLPPSLSVPVEQDNVRKAILEARERAKEKAVLASSAADGTPPEEQIETAHGYDSPDYGLDEDTNDMEEEDDDAMDMSWLWEKINGITFFGSLCQSSQPFYLRGFSLYTLWPYSPPGLHPFEMNKKHYLICVVSFIKSSIACTAPMSREPAPAGAG
jgi:hypothetical protein